MERLPGKAALLIIDAQEGFLPAVFEAPAAMRGIERLLTAARKAKLPVIFTQEMHRKEGVDFGRELDGSEGVHCLEGTEDVEIAAALRPLDGEYRVVKRRYSCFFATDLDLLLRGLNVQTLIVCGFLTDVCVHYTCVDAHQHDYYVRVAVDAVSGSTPEAHEASLRAIQYLQSAAPTNADEIEALLGAAIGR
ncbi:isochorismatase family cysteine hydrolase [Paenibacillus sp.]|uniref:cysteine hydrolase family protein n=1 Tax=Paenibacillus sp. TaxID=58172 RepID=UPI002D4D2882|nr:isochorismatase family cysteine hydrolase [Paenibacillus sp.]HZG87603.1 isochorismatase family cysteine hydrolase [Paenibacillus sp.]